CCIIIKMAFGDSAIGFANPARSIGRFIGGQWTQPQPPAELPRALANVSDPDLAFVVHRMIGNAGPVGDRLLTRKYQKIIEITAQLRKAIGHRKVVFNDSGLRKDGRCGGEPLCLYSSGLIYFLGGFRVMSAVTEPIMSIWLMSDYKRWQVDVVN